LIVAAILKMATGRNWSMSGINSGHHYLPTYQIVMIKIQHCPISSQFDMWVDNDVLNWFPTLKNFYWFYIGQCWIFAILWWPFWKWWPVEIFQCQESIRDIIIYPHIKFWWYRTMLNFYRPFFIPYFGIENLTCIFVKNNLECHNFRHVFRGTIDFARVTLHVQE
jgi:hypothetical protein